MFVCEPVKLTGAQTVLPMISVVVSRHFRSMFRAKTSKTSAYDKYFPTGAW